MTTEGKPTQIAEVMHEAQKLVDRIAQLEAENAQLRAENEKMCVDVATALNSIHALANHMMELDRLSNELGSVAEAKRRQSIMGGRNL